MKSIKVKIVGVGGIGSWLVDPLCTMLANSNIPHVDVFLIDGDTYEQRNRERQNFDEIGPKATVTAARLRKKFPQITFWDHPAYLTDANIVQHIREKDFVVSCVDNHKTRKLISDRAEELDDVVVVSGGNELTDGNVYLHVKRDGKDLTLPIANRFHPELMHPDDKNPGDDKEHGCQVMQESAPQLVATNFCIASVMLNVLYKTILLPEKPIKYSETNVDILFNQMKSVYRQ